MGEVEDTVRKKMEYIRLVKTIYRHMETRVPRNGDELCISTPKCQGQCRDWRVGVWEVGRGQMLSTEFF